MVSIGRRDLLLGAAASLAATPALAQSYSGGPVSFSIRTIGGLILPTLIRWSGDRQRLTVSHESGALPTGAEQDVSRTTRMLVSRATAIQLNGSADAARGEGFGYVGNARFSLEIAHRIAGGRLSQVVTIIGYNRRVFTDSEARLLFQ
ncbi:MAG TPA: hypothetical protein VJ890_01010 [Vineibacter sp.]|nr:hypothetical protein [Vineibacter sp.]